MAQNLSSNQPFSNGGLHSRRLPRYLRLLAFASICFVALLPTAIIGIFQQYRSAEQMVNQFALHASTLIHQANEGPLSPRLVVSTTQNNRLVLWSTFYRGTVPVARAGLPLPANREQALTLIEIKPRESIRPQLPPPRMMSFSVPDFRVRIPLGSWAGKSDTLEIGVSYAALYSTVQDQLALSAVLFFTALLFLLGAAIFIDLYISRFTTRVIRALRSKADLELGLGEHIYAPTFGLLMDALERREDQILDTRNTLEAVFNGLQIGVSMISTDLKVVLVNRFLEGLLAGKFLIGRDSSELNLPGQKPRAEELCRKALASLKLETQDVEVLLEGSRRHSFLQEAYPLLDEEGDPLAVIFQCRDVTAERNFNRELGRQLEDQKAKLLDTQQKLLQSARLAAIGELAGGVAHEINNPNGLILAGARYLLNRLSTDSEAVSKNGRDYLVKYLERIVKQSERVGDIVRALLTFSRRRPQQKDLIRIEDCIHDALELASARFALPGPARVEFTQDIPRDIPLIRGNRFELGQVFLNLFNNAVDAMPGGGQIRVSARVADDNLLILVKDSGGGIPADLLDKVMEPFFTTKEVGKGTGLGLSISHGIIEEHSGTMRVRNHPEGGAEFEIRLPLPGEKESR